MSIVNPARRRAATVWLGKTGSVVFGLVLVVAGAAAVFLSANAAGTAALIGAGLILVVLGAFGDRIKIFKAAGVELTLGEVTRRLAEADVAEKEGDDDLARQLRDEALRLVSAAEPLASEYKHVRAALPSGNERTSRMQAVVNRGHDLAKRPTLRRDDVKKLFSDQDEGKRITALAILQKRPDLGNLDILVGSITGSKSAFEQYQGLLAARAAVEAKALTDEELAALKEELRVQLATGHISGTDRPRIAEAILAS